MPVLVKDVIDNILSAVPGAPLAETVDTLKSGQMTDAVDGVVTTFIATMDVLKKTVQSGANFIITHEPTYYNHEDKTDWLKDDPVYQTKRKFIEDNHLIIWRFHDQWHMHQPDGIITGFSHAMGWDSYREPDQYFVFNIPDTPLSSLIKQVKEHLQIPHLRVVGPDEMTCRKVAAIVGAAPGEWHIEAMSKQGIDTIVCGEVSEWQVYEYVRDANLSGTPRALIVAGHERSEEPGMAYLAEWLKQRMPNLPVAHIPAGDSLKIC